MIACVDEQPESIPKAEIPHQLNKVQKWFLEHKDELLINTVGSDLRTESQELILPFFEKEPDWNKFHVYQFPDGREVYEINLANAQLYYPASLKDSLPNTAPSEAVIQNIMFVENKQNGRFDPIIARYYPNNEASIRDFEEIYYNKIDLAWSGVLDLWTYDERHFVGFNIVEGDLISSFTYDKGEVANARKIKGGENLLTNDCHTTSIRYATTTVTAGSYTTTHYTTELIRICSSSGGSSTSGTPSGTYTYSGGGYGNTEGNSANTNPVTYYAPPSVPRPIIINQLTNPCAKDIFLEIKKGSFINSIKGQTEFSKDILDLFENSQKYDYVISNTSLGEGIAGGTSQRPEYNAQTGRYEISILLGDEYLAKATKLSIARTIIHESIHAYLQYEQYTDPFGSVNDGLRRYSIAKGYTGLRGNKEHHEFMSQYIDAIAHSLQSWDLLRGTQGNLPAQYFKDLAWGGLANFKNTYGQVEYYQNFMDMVTSQIDRNRILNNISNEFEGNGNAKGTKCK